MCHTKWIFTLAITILGATSIDVTKPSSPCEVKVELLDRMINVVNKDELCLCLMYEKATSPHKTSEPCNLNIVNSGGNLIISADSMCECAGYETNRTLKYTTGSDIPDVTITKASTADDMLSEGDRTETVTRLPTDTTTDDKVKDKILLSNSSVTEVLDLTPTTNGTTETKKVITDHSKRLTTDYTITTTIPFVYSFKNSSTAIESGTTEEIEESKPTTLQQKKSIKMHFSYIGKVVTTDWTTDIPTPTVVFTDGTKTIDATKETAKSKISLIDIVRNSTTTTYTTERTTVTKDKPLDVKHFHTSHITVFTDLSENTSTPNITHTTDKLLLVLSNVTSSKADYSTRESYSSTKGKLSSIFVEADTSESLSTTNKKDLLETILTTPIETIASTTVTDFGYKKVIPISTTSRNNYTTKNETSRTTTPNVTNKSTVSTTTEVVYHSNYTGTDYYTKVKSTPNITHTTDKLLLVLSNVTSSKADYSTRESYSSTNGKLSTIFKEADTSEILSTTNKKDLLETILTTIESIASTTVTDFGYKRVVPISTTSRNNYTTKFKPNRTTTPNVTNKSTVSKTTEVVYHSNYTGTDGYTKVKSTKVDAESAGVITEGTSTTTTPITIQSTTDSSYTESDIIKGDVISYTNITLITILTIICVVLIILLIVKIIKSCLRKGSYVLPHESDRNIEMDCK